MPSVKSKLKDNIPLKPIQPTQYWTFENALKLLENCEDPFVLEALDEFLLLNKDVILNPMPFNGKINIKKDIKELTIRSILYTNITSLNISDGEQIEKFLNLNLKEIVRVICQICKKIPPKTQPEFVIKSKLHDDRDKSLDNERLALYVSKILRERRIMLKIVTELLSNKTNDYASLTVQNLGREIYLSDEYISQLIDSIKQTIQYLIKGDYETGIKRIDEIILNESVLFIIESTKVLIDISYYNTIVTKDIINSWFKLMREINFGLTLSSCIDLVEPLTLIQSLFTIISVQYLNLNDTFETVENDELYISDYQTFKNINETITNSAVTNSVVLYCWSIILLRKSYFIQEFPRLSKVTPFLPDFNAANLDQIINSLNEKCINLGIFITLKKINELVEFNDNYSTILSSIIMASMPLISLTPEVTDAIVSIMESCPNYVVEQFFENESTKNAIIVARTKFPLLLTPYINLASINGNFAFHEFNELKSFIQLFKKEEFNDMYQIDDQDTELVKITESIDVYPPFEVSKKLSMVFNKGTRAKILPAANSDETLATFLFNYNGWAFLGRVLQNVSKVYNSDPVKAELVVCILNLLNKVVLDNGVDVAKLVTEAMSAYTDDSDILEVILRLLEQGLHSRNTKLSVFVFTLLTNMMPFLSYRIWPYLSKSALFSNDGKEGFATIIFGAIEMVKGDYKFTIALIKLAEALTQNCIYLNEDYPKKSKAKIMVNFVNHLISLFESFTYCKFNQQYEKLEIGVLILDIFSTILATVYGIDEGAPIDSKATNVFTDASNRILEAFLASDTESRATFPITSMIDSVSQELEMYELTDISGFCYDSWIRCCMSFSQLIINIRSVANLPPSNFEKVLFEKAPILVTLYSTYEFVKTDVLDLLSCLTNGQWEQTPSLLSHLGKEKAQVLLHSLAADLGNSFDDYKLKISLNDFICAVMNGKQEGLAVLFITGRDVFGDITKKDQNTNKISLISILKRNVRDMKYLPNSVSIHLVDAIALASNLWTTVKESEHDEEFIKTLISRVKLEMSEPNTSEDFINRCYEFKLVAKIAEILALYLFTTKNEKCKNEIIKFINSEDFIEIAKEKFMIKNYQPQLHSNTQLLFESTYSFKLIQFTSGLNKRNRFGITSVYNLALMNSLFQDDQDWAQIREQVIASSINLQYINSQLASAKSFGALITSFNRKYEGTLTNSLNLVNHLIKLNIEEGLVFESIYHERIELSFYLMYKYFSKNDKANVFEIIKNSSNLLSSTSMNFINNLSESKGYYRPLLKVIYCSLKLVDPNLLIEYFSLFKDLFELIITNGVKTLLIEIQNEVYLSKNDKSYKFKNLNNRIDDLMIILSILKIFISISGPMLHEEMARLVEENGTIKALLNLYSISHYIEVNEEYVFAQLSLQFLLELMSVEIIGEKIIQSGLFIVLVESQISHSIRLGQTNHSSQKLWTNGIQPIIISSLFKLGHVVVPEICVVLRLFSKQIENCIENWAKDSSSIIISTSLIAETSQILIIYNLLKSYNVDGYLQSINGESLPGLNTESKQEDFVDCIENLLKHPKFLSSRIVPSSIEEQTAMEKGGDTLDKFTKKIIDEIKTLKDFIE
ncbi:unnamed protein product [Candida verbasci]|uniref:Nucleoporin NUP188 n=1 Tax=Candida verbasci TaxID=1227364 RepID=A0A9W4TS71_9ASCO|nr:unnamed protein product [Candida verbasci]